MWNKWRTSLSLCVGTVQDRDDTYNGDTAFSFSNPQTLMTLFAVLSLSFISSTVYRMFDLSFIITRHLSKWLYRTECCVSMSSSVRISVQRCIVIIIISVTRHCANVSYLFSYGVIQLTYQTTKQEWGLHKYVNATKMMTNKKE